MTRISVLLLGAFMVLAGIVGCQNSPGALFSPTSDIQVLDITPSPAIITVAAAEGALTATWEETKISFSITNGVGVFWQGYTLSYVTTNGSPVLDGTLDHSGSLSKFVSAGEPSDVKDGELAGDIALHVVTNQVWEYMTNGTLSASDDKSPIICKIILRGRDSNDREIVKDTHVNLVTIVELATEEE